MNKNIIWGSLSVLVVGFFAYGLVSGPYDSDSLVGGVVKGVSNKIEIEIEGEDYTRINSPMVVESDTLASGGEYVWSSPVGGGGGAVFYSFDIPVSGRYVIWGRVVAPSASKDSFYVNITDDDGYINGGEPEIWDVSNSTSWHYDRVSGRTNNKSYRKFFLSEGSYQVRFKARESGVKLDKIIITNDLNTVPSDDVSIEKFDAYFDSNGGIIEIDWRTNRTADAQLWVKCDGSDVNLFSKEGFTTEEGQYTENVTCNDGSSIMLVDYDNQDHNYLGLTPINDSPVTITFTLLAKDPLSVGPFTDSSEETLILEATDGEVPSIACTDSDGGRSCVQGDGECISNREDTYVKGFARGYLYGGDNVEFGDVHDTCSIRTETGTRYVSECSSYDACGISEAFCFIIPDEKEIALRNPAFIGCPNGCSDGACLPDDGLPMAAQCSDEIDNDGDGLIDFPNDPGCDSTSDDDETDSIFIPPTRIEVDLVSSLASVEGDTGVFSMVFDVTAVGGTVYVGDTAVATTVDRASIWSVNSGVDTDAIVYRINHSGIPITNDLSDVVSFTTPGGVTDSTDNIKIEDGATARVTLTVVKRNRSIEDDGIYYMELAGVGWGTGDDTTYENVYRYPYDGDLKTNKIIVGESTLIDVNLVNSLASGGDGNRSDGYLGTFSMTFDITAYGGTVYVGDTAAATTVADGQVGATKRDAIVYRISGRGIPVTNGLADTVSFTTPGGVTDSTDNIKIEEGATTRVTLTTTRTSNLIEDDGFYYMNLAGIGWGTSDDTTYENTYISYLGDFRTNGIFIGEARETIEPIYLMIKDDFRKRSEVDRRLVPESGLANAQDEGYRVVPQQGREVNFWAFNQPGASRNIEPIYEIWHEKSKDYSYSGWEDELETAIVDQGWRYTSDTNNTARQILTGSYTGPDSVGTLEDIREASTVFYTYLPGGEYITLTGAKPVLMRYHAGNTGSNGRTGAEDYWDSYFTINREEIAITNYPLRTEGVRFLGLDNRNPGYGVKEVEPVYATSGNIFQKISSYTTALLGQLFR